MIIVTIDTNVLIKAGKPNELGYDLVQKLIEMHQAKLIQLQVVAANASENGRSLNDPSRGLLTDLEKLGISDATVLRIPAILNMAYLGFAYLTDETEVAVQEAIWSILFGTLPFNHAEFCKYYGIAKPDDSYLDDRWRNKMCDVLTVFQYMKDSIYKQSQHDITIFISADNDDILKKADRLKEFGAHNILNLAQAIEKIEQIKP
jgi:hypothetical protein